MQPIFWVRRVGRDAGRVLHWSESAGMDVHVVLTSPLLFGKTNQRPASSPSANRGHASFHSFSVVTTIGASGTSRLPVSDFGESVAFQRSARCRTVRTLRSRS